MCADSTDPTSCLCLTFPPFSEHTCPSLDLSVGGYLNPVCLSACAGLCLNFSCALSDLRTPFVWI